MKTWRLGVYEPSNGICQANKQQNGQSTNKDLYMMYIYIYNYHYMVLTINKGEATSGG